MLPFKLVYSDAYYLPLGEHVFPAEKYRLVREKLEEDGISEPEDFIEPVPASDDEILLVHTGEYLEKLKSGTLSLEERLQLEVPYSPELVEAFRLAAGGSILAGRLAIRDGVGINLGGGFHHAFPDHGEGFCVINDVAVAIRRLLEDEAVRTVMTVDCDVHQGNGTAVVFSHAPVEPDGPARNENVFTISLHQRNIYPAEKPPSSIDVNLYEGIGDEGYLEHLDDALRSGFERFSPELICYLAGADPYREDRLGGLGLTMPGLALRDERVFRAARERGIPVMVTLAGGYAARVEDTVAIHCNTVAAAARIFGRPGERTGDGGR